MTIVESHHQPTQRGFNIICAQSPDVELNLSLQMAINAINGSVSPDGLIPTYLSVMPIFVSAFPTIDRPHRHLIVKKKFCEATSEKSNHFANRQIRNAIRTRNDPDVSDVLSVQLGGHDLVNRPRMVRWEGPYSFFDVKDGDITVLVPSPSGPTKFCSTAAKRYMKPTNYDSTDSPKAQINLVSSDQQGRVREHYFADDYQQFRSWRHCFVPGKICSASHNWQAPDLDLSDTRV